jgi:branched-chain amino acid transport system permease protein
MVTTSAPAAATSSADLPAALDAKRPIPRWLIVALIAAALLPVVAGQTTGFGLISNFYFLQLSLMIVYAIAVLGLNLLTGFNGQISLGHGAFFAVGAYVAAIMIDRYSLPFWTALPAAAIVCFCVGYVFGKPALRLEGHYLALATFALAIAVPQFLKYRHFEEFTNGVQGINLFKPETPFGLPFSADQFMYWVALACAIVMFWAARNLLDSRMGRAMMAIRDHSMAADTMGIDTARVKTITFGISALYTGVAGALHAIIFEFVSPDSFRFELSIALLVGAVVGGIATIPGAVFGGIFVQVIEKYVDAVTKKITQTLHLPIELEQWTIYGIALIVLMYVMPHGIGGALAARRARRRAAAG